MKNRQIQLSLNDRKLTCYTLDGDGEITAEYIWKVRDYSVLPRALFHLMRSFVLRELRRLPEKDLPSVRLAIKNAVREAGKASGCGIKNNISGGDIVWRLDDELFAAFQFHKKRLNKERAAELAKSGALLRIIFTCDEKGFFKLHPRKTRSD